MDIIKILKESKKLPLVGEIRNYYILIFFLLILYIITKNVLIGLICGFSILTFFFYEIYEGIKNHGIKKELVEILVAVLAAFLIYNFIGFLLNTPTPISAIVSCSMLPHYNRGDLVIIGNWELNTISLNYNKELEKEMQKVEVYYKDKQIPINTSIYLYCSQNTLNEFCQKFIYSEPENFYEKIGPLKIDYKMCKKINLSTKNIINLPCVNSTYFENRLIQINKNSDLIVYNPKKKNGEIEQIDIIHRLVFIVNSTDGVYYFTKGDNNPIYDFQYYLHSQRNYLIKKDQIKGKLLLSIPYIGNLKLVITPQVLLLDEIQTGCWGYFLE
ncbi:MAG: hypothetical protein QW833_00295 [Candidatus Anstonellaceae archaeon]